MLPAVELEKESVITNSPQIRIDKAGNVQSDVALNKPVSASSRIVSSVTGVNENFHAEYPLIAAKVRIPFGVRMERVPLSKST